MNRDKPKPTTHSHNGRNFTIAFTWSNSSATPKYATVQIEEGPYLNVSPFFRWWSYASALADATKQAEKFIDQLALSNKKSRFSRRRLRLVSSKRECE